MQVAYSLFGLFQITLGRTVVFESQYLSSLTFIGAGRGVEPGPRPIRLAVLVGPGTILVVTGLGHQVTSDTAWPGVDTLIVNCLWKLEKYTSNISVI